MAYILTLIVSITDWVVSLSFFCAEVRTTFCRNHQQFSCGREQRRTTCKGIVSRACGALGGQTVRLRSLTAEQYTKTWKMFGVM